MLVEAGWRPASEISPLVEAGFSVTESEGRP